MSEQELSLDDVFRAPTVAVGGIELVEATELEIAAAIVVLKARTRYYGANSEPLEVKAHPFRPDYGWRQAALSWIRKNRLENEKGRVTQI